MGHAGSPDRGGPSCPSGGLAGPTASAQLKTTIPKNRHTQNRDPKNSGTVRGQKNKNSENQLFTKKPGFYFCKNPGLIFSRDSLFVVADRNSPLVSLHRNPAFSYHERKWFAKNIKLLDKPVRNTAPILFNCPLPFHNRPHLCPRSGLCFAFRQPFVELRNVPGVLPAVLLGQVRLCLLVPGNQWGCHYINKVFIHIKPFANMPTNKRRQQRQQPPRMRMPQYRRQPTRYPSAQRTINTAINAGVTLGTVAIGASVLTGVVGALTK